MKDEFPQSWKILSFMEIFDVEGGTQPSKSVFKYQPRENYIQLLQIRDFGDRSVPTYIPLKPTLKICEKNDILIGRYGASVGRICTGLEGAYNVALTKVVIPEQIDRKYVFYLLHSLYFQRPILAIERSAQNGFNKEDLKEILVPIAPANEQRRIVVKLERLISKIRFSQDRLSKSFTLLKRFRRSVLAAAYSGRLTSDWRKEHRENDWASASVGSIFKSFGGGTPDRSNSTYWKGKIPWLSSGDIKTERISNASEFITSAGLDRSSASLCRPGSLLIVVRSGILKHTLPVAILDIEAAINQDIKCFDSGDNDLNCWLAFAWKASESYFLERAREGTTVQSIKFETLRDFELKLPSKLEREVIVRRVNELFVLIDRIEVRYLKAKENVTTLIPSMLAKAFRGELVKQDPKDEPASVLLERVKASQNSGHEQLVA